MLLIYQLVPAIADVISDEDAFPVNKFSKSLLVFVVDVSAFSAIAAVISNDDALRVNN